MKYIIDASTLSFEPGVRIVETFDTVAEVMQCKLVSDLTDKQLQQEVYDFCREAEPGYYKDFGVFTIFVGYDKFY